MCIEKLSEFQEELVDILDYISKDSLQKAIKFNNQLKEHIDAIVDMPFKHRKSIHFDDENIRDLIFKGYTTTYYIDMASDKIILLGIKKYKKDFLLHP